jgi:hypothetical protein
MIEICNVNWGGYCPGGRRSISACSERAQSESNKIYSANNVADSNAGVNGNNSNESNSNDEGDGSFYSDGGDLGETMAKATTVRMATRASINTPVAIYTEDSGMENSSVPDSNTTDAYSVDLLNSDLLL